MHSTLRAYIEGRSRPDPDKSGPDSDNLVSTILTLLRQELQSEAQQGFLISLLLPQLESRLRQALSRDLYRGFDEHHLQTVRPKVNEKSTYMIFECLQPATVWATLDLGEAREGDRFVITSLLRVGDGEFKPHEVYTLDDQREEPIITLSARFAPACRLMLAQTRGISKPVTVEVFARYEGDPNRLPNHRLPDHVGSE